MVMARVEVILCSLEHGRNSTETTLSLSTSLVVAKHMLRYKHSSFVHECGPENSHVFIFSVKSYESLFLDSNSLQHRFRFRDPLKIITGPLSLEKRLRFKHSIIEFKVLGELIVAI
ncbi:hypothetical protein F8388_011979 [Cannabis sativa]|uniref:Uncharacterized protein n=1 Tax=Cannabis sativa TaxID=3483 RepID=A0A7J6GE31_CANSA|nr:hypothetical protein F8388_011979 [Cannabis sativa]